MVNNYDKSDAGYETVVGALNSMMNVAASINEMKRQHEHAIRTQELQCLLSGWSGADLASFGQMVLEVEMIPYTLRYVYN